MAFGNATFSDVAGAVGDILQGQSTASGLRLKAQGDLAEATNYGFASDLAAQNEEFAKVSTSIKETQQQRQEYLAIGQTTADIAGSGFSTGSGSALDILRSGAAQGALTKQVIGEQGQIQEAGYDEQRLAYTNMQNAANAAAAGENSLADEATKNGDIMGAIKGAAGLATLFTGGALDNFNVTQLAAPSLIGSGEYVGPLGYSPSAD